MTASGPRWVSIPPGSSRWLLPTAPRGAAVCGLSIYHPVTIRGLIGWQAARAAASLGSFRFLPGGASPPPEVGQLLSGQGISFRYLALARANHPSRFLALLLGASFRPSGVAKMAFDERGRDALRREAVALEEAGNLAGRVRAPHLLHASDGLLVLEPVAWLPRITPWRLPPDVAHALGAYSSMTEQGGGGTDTRAHGDFAPWNLLRVKDGWVLLDWEHASIKPPFFDLWHYLLQSHSLLGRPSSGTLMDGLKGGRGWVRTALVEYARGAGRAPGEALDFFDSYIHASAEQLAGKSQNEKHGLSARARLHREIAELRE
jgi:Phosphotransferase enzyme family